MDIRVLLVDDSQDILSYLKLVLRHLQIDEILCASNGVAALKCIESQADAFDLIFVDLHMPEMDGVQFINELAKRNFEGAIAIASSLDKRLVSLVANITRQKNIHILGCIDKPIMEENITNIIKKYSLLFHEKMAALSLVDKQQLLDYMDSQRLIPYFQPKINKSDGELRGYEMLARINLPDNINTLLPDSFIPVAEANELIGELSFHLADIALDQFCQLTKDMRERCKLSINLSPIMLKDPDIIRDLDKLIKKHGMLPSQIVLEITEQNAINKVEQLETFSRLRIKGYGLSLDDYGTGYTNVQQLKSLPFTEIKIDRSLVFNICDDKVSQVIVNSILEVAKELSVDVILEGVENCQDLDYLNKLEYDFILQGFLISKPKPMNEVQEWYKSWLKSNKVIDTELLH